MPFPHLGGTFGETGVREKSFHFHFISLHIFYEDCRKVTYILVKAALLQGYLYQVSGKEDIGGGGNKSI